MKPVHCRNFTPEPMTSTRRRRIILLLLVAGALLAFGVKVFHDNKDLEFIGKAEPLNAAIEANDVVRIESLIAQDKSILMANGFKSTTPLNYAVRRGQPEIAELLLRHGADVNLPDHALRRQTPCRCRRSTSANAVD